MRRFGKFIARKAKRRFGKFMKMRR